MKRMFHCAALAVCVSLIGSVRAEPVSTLEWMVYDVPPYEIVTGPYKGQGAADGLRQRLMTLLPEYAHSEPVLVNGERMHRLLKKQNVCHTALIRSPEFEQSMYLSIAVIMANTHVIITNKEHYDTLIAQGASASVQQLLQQTPLKLGHLSRSLGPEVDAILASESGNPNIVDRRSAYTDQGLFKMLHKGRIDYFIELPSQGMYWNMLNPDKQVYMIPISEMRERYIIGRVGCTKNPWGRKVIERVNQVMKEQRMDENYIRSLTFRWVPQSMREDFIEHYTRIIAADNWSNVGAAE
ncbi:MAG: TIGR02285 family protein [Pseudomonadales bacterium]